MKKLIQAFIDKYLCLHEWELIHTCRIYSSDYEAWDSKGIPESIKYTYKCTKCGKIIKISA